MEQKPIKHKSDKEIIKLLYSKFGKSIYCLINQSGNLFEVVLDEKADFELVSDFIDRFKDDQNKFDDDDAFVNGDGFSMVFLKQIGNSKHKIVAINAEHKFYTINYNNEEQTFSLVKLRNANEIDIYRNFFYMEALRRIDGEWKMFVFDDLGKQIGKIIETDPKLRESGINIKNRIS